MTNDRMATNLYNEAAIIQELATVLRPLQVQLEPISRIAEEQSRRFADLVIPILDNTSFKESIRQATEIAESIRQSFAVPQIQDLLKNVSEMVKFNQEVIESMAQPIIACSFQANLSSMSLFLQDEANPEPPKSVFSIQTKSIEFLHTRAVSTDEKKEASVVAGQIVKTKQGAVEFRQEQSVAGTLVAATPEQLLELKQFVKANMSDQELEEELERRGGQLVVRHIDEMTLIRQENPILVINGKEIEFDGSTYSASVVRLIFGRQRNWNKTIPRDLFREKILNDPKTKEGRKMADSKIDDYVRQINTKIGRILTGETDFITTVKGGFRVNPELLK